ncbi:MAG: hypothetical protein ACRBBQ_00560 [Cognatishimia sp.]
MYRAMRRRGHLQVAGTGLELTGTGARFVSELGVNLAALSKGRAPICRECLDWSARESHLAGKLGRALLAEFFAKGWAKRQENSRIVRFSREGAKAFETTFSA